MVTMGYEGLDFDDIAGGVSPAFVETLYRRYKADPTGIEPGWRAWFEGLENTASGPSWANPRWPLAETDALTAGLDPTQMEPAPKPAKGGAAPAAKPAGPAASEADIARAAGDSIRAMLLIRTYRVRGHLAATLDPLGLVRQDLPADMTPEYHGFTGADLDRPIYLGGALGLEKATIRELVDTLRANYCGNVGLEYMHIADVEERRFLQERMEGKDKAIQFTVDGKKAILSKVIEAEEWERFCGKKYVGTKRFGLDGGEAMIPAMEAIIKYGGQLGVREIVYGMAHRGRLNMLTNVMNKPYRAIFHEFSGGSSNPDDVGGSGDVKYHLGTSTDRDFDGISVHMSLVANPSHLEAADPVVLGKTRAIADDCAAISSSMTGSLPVLLHGDAAMAGQGIVWECLGFSGIRGYNTGGCIHFIINNQIGFTTSPQFARSSPYPSDVAKGRPGADLPRQWRRSRSGDLRLQDGDRVPPAFKRDVVIDMWCYRRFGHNEGDEPSFTQPLMYKAIRQHPPVSAVYSNKLIAEGVINQGWVDEKTRQFNLLLEGEFEAAQATSPTRPTGSRAAGPACRRRRSRDRASQRRDRHREEAVRQPRPHADRGPRRPGDPQDAGPRARCQACDVHERREVSTGRPARHWPLARCFRKAMASACRARIRPRHLQPAPRRLGRSEDEHRYVPLATIPHGRSRCSIRRSANMACSASNTAMRWPIRRRWCCGKRSSATSPTARRS
jgi:2-oxoglutarate dehydrogenase E1 component